MALRFVDSFDHYSTAQIARKWTSITGSPVISAGNGRNADSLRITTNNYSANLTLDSQATWIIGFAFRYNAAPSAADKILEVLDGATLHLDFVVNAALTISARRGGSTVLGTSSAIPTATYMFLEIKVTISDTVGVVQIKKDGVLILDLSGQDTRNAGNATADNFTFGSAGSAQQRDYDDLHIMDTSGSVNNDFIGDRKVEAKLPGGAGNYNQWTPSAGANYQNVDDNPSTDDTDYNSSSTAAQKDSFAVQDLTTTSGSVSGVQIVVTARKDDAGSRTIRHLIRQGGSDFFGSNKAIADGYDVYNHIAETDPNTGIAWTIGGVNSAEFGYELVS